MRRSRSARLAGLSGLTCAALLLAGCSGGGGGEASPEPASQDEVEEALSTPTELVFWTWVPDIQKEVDLFMEEYPEIDVEIVNVGQGAPHYQKLRAALESGQGAPDVAQVEFQHLDSFILGEHLLDLAPHGMAEMQDAYPEWVWNQVVEGEAVYGVPQDTGPMGLLYREDILTAAGLEVPGTWEEFAEAARTIHAANPEQFLTNLPGNDAGQVMGLLWQAGAKPFDYDGEETVTIDLDTPEVKQVMDYWNGLIQEGVVSTDPDFNDAWYQGLANGRYASWPTAAWGPVFLQGTAGSTSGLWRAAPLPQWEEGENAAGNWGGSTDAVLAGTENPIAAAELARWINVEEEPAKMLASEQFLFPATNAVLEDPEFTGAEAEFYGGQKVNELFTGIAQQVDTEFGWLPFMDYAYSQFEETVGKAIADRTDLSTATAAWEDALTTYAEEQGFTVK